MLLDMGTVVSDLTLSFLFARDILAFDGSIQKKNSLVRETPMVAIMDDRSRQLQAVNGTAFNTVYTKVTQTHFSHVHAWRTDAHPATIYIIHPEYNSMVMATATSNDVLEPDLRGRHRISGCRTEVSGEFEQRTLGI